MKQINASIMFLFLEVLIKKILDSIDNTKHLALISTTQIYTHINPVSIKKIKSPLDFLE